MTSVLITGANRGIGLGLVRQFLKEPTVAIVIATVRKFEEAKELSAIDNPKLRIIACEITDESSVAAAVEKVSVIVDGKGLDILVNNAGIFRPLVLDGAVSKADVMRQFDVNAFGPLLVANKFHCLLKRAAELNGSAQVANISSALGSLEMAMGEATHPPAIYAMSKAALNMLTRKLSFEWKADKIRATAFSPGWVRTDMGTQDAALSVEESTSALVKLIMSLTEEHNGEFYNIAGEKIPW